MTTRATVLVMTLLAAAVCNGPEAQTVVRHEPTSEQLRDLKDRLAEVKRLTGTPAEAQVHSLILVLPAQRGGVARLSIRNTPGARLPRVRTVGPQQSRSRPGLYLGVLDAHREVAWLVPVSDPRRVLGEGVENPGTGQLVGGTYRTREGALAARFPFVPDGTVFLYESVRPPTGPMEARVFFMVKLGQTPFPEAWSELEVVSE